VVLEDSHVNYHNRELIYARFSQESIERKDGSRLYVRSIIVISWENEDVLYFQLSLPW